MKKEDFYRKYANLPLEKRMILIPDGSQEFPKGTTLNFTHLTLHSMKSARFHYSLMK